MSVLPEEHFLPGDSLNPCDAACMQISLSWKWRWPPSLLCSNIDVSWEIYYM